MMWPADIPIGLRKVTCARLRRKGASSARLCYYWAANIRCVYYWLDETVVLADWLDLEREDCLPSSLGAIVMSPVRLKKSYYNNNLIIHNTIQIWRQITKQLKLRALSFHVPLSSNPLFTPSIMDGTFDRWRELEWVASAIYTSVLQEKYGLARADFFKYLQIRHFVRTHLHDFETATPDKLDHCLRECLAERHT
ncbi:hypothetical protein F7725_020938, partial [Dissostichus mawsoni]